jgi:poly(hydroxyalkanoate) granule-associated protein
MSIGTNRGAVREGDCMAARKKTRKVESTVRKARARVAGAPAALIENVQQIWLAGMGAIAKAQKEGPGAFQDAVAEGLKLLSRSRSNAEEMIRDAFESAQESVQSRVGTARDQATETWDNLETLFQNRVHKAMQQLGVPSGEEIRLLTKRVEELNASVQAMSSRKPRGRKPAPAKRRARKA